MRPFLDSMFKISNNVCHHVFICSGRDTISSHSLKNDYCIYSNKFSLLNAVPTLPHVLWEKGGKLQSKLATFCISQIRLKNIILRTHELQSIYLNKFCIQNLVF